MYLRSAFCFLLMHDFNFSSKARAITWAKLYKTVLSCLQSGSIIFRIYESVLPTITYFLIRRVTISWNQSNQQHVLIHFRFSKRAFILTPLNKEKETYFFLCFVSLRLPSINSLTKKIHFKINVHMSCKIPVMCVFNGGLALF